MEFDGSLNAVIRDVREVLGDSAKNPRYIETEPKLGYRFIAPVRSLRGSEPQVPDPDEPVDRQEGEGEVWSTALPMHPAPALAQPDSSASLRARRRLAFLLAFPASVCALAAGWWGLSRSGEPLRAPTISQYSYYVGKVGHPTFSPDGARIAFHWNADDKGGFDIYRKGYYSDDLVRLTHDPADDVYPAWSPDGREIAFGRRLANGRMAVLVVPAAGGPERRVAELPHEGPFAWAADGQAIAYSVAFPLGMPGVGEKGGIWIVQLATGERTRITSPGHDSLGDICPAFSPDGNWLAFVRVFSSGVHELELLNIRRNLQPRSEPRQLTFDSQFVRDPAWTPDSKQIVFASQRRGHISLWRIPISGSRAEPVSLGGEGAVEPAVDSSGRRILFSRLTTVDTIERLELREGVEAEPVKLSYSRKEATNPAYSPDGNRIAFESSRSGHVEVWVCGKDGADERQLTHLTSPDTGTPRWSPDGRLISFDARVDGKADIFVVASEGGEPRRLTSGRSENIVPSWSGDGRWIYFGSDRTGMFQIWKIRVEGGDPVQVTRQGGFHAIESRDGSTLYYTKGSLNTSVWSVPVGGGQESKVFDSLSYWQNFAVSRLGIYLVPFRMGRSFPVEFLPFDGGKRRTVARLDAASVNGLAESPDGSGLLMSLRKSDEADLMLLELSR